MLSTVATRKGLSSVALLALLMLASTAARAADDIVQPSWKLISTGLPNNAELLGVASGAGTQVAVGWEQKGPNTIPLAMFSKDGVSWYPAALAGVGVGVLRSVTY